MAFAVCKRTRNGFPRLFPLLLLGFSTGLAIAQSSDSYLDAIEGEASELSLDQKTRAQSEDTSRSVNVAPGAQEGEQFNQLVPGLTVVQFEQVLKRSYIGSYLFYNRLPNNLKDEVYESYLTDSNPDAVRAKIIEVSKK